MPRDLTPSHIVAEPDAARYIGFTVSALRKWRRVGRGPRYFQLGRSVRYSTKDLDAWLEQHVVQTRESA